MRKPTCPVIILLLLPALVACTNVVGMEAEETPIPKNPTATLPQDAAAGESGHPFTDEPSTEVRNGPSSDEPGSPVEAGRGLIFLWGGTIYQSGADGERALGSLPADARHLALHHRRLAYVLGNRIDVLDLPGGTVRTLLEFPDRPGQDFDLRWSADGSSLAYAIAWDEPDGSRLVELGTHDGEEHTVLGTLNARPEGPSPILPSMPPVPPMPGHANLLILGLDTSATRLAVTQAGGQERYAALWILDSQTGECVEAEPLPRGTEEVALSPDMRWLAVAVPGVLQIWPLDADTLPILIELPAETHGARLSWSPDSQRLAYLLNEGAAPALDASPALALEAWEVQTGQTGRVASAIGTYATLHGWIDDGKTVVLETFDESSGRVALCLVDVEAGQSSPLPPIPAGSRVLKWGSVGEATTE